MSQVLEQTQQEVSNFEEVSVRGTSLERLLEEAEDIQNMCSDFIVKNVGIHNVLFHPSTKVLAFEPEGHSVTYRHLSRFALSQFCSKIGVPFRYIDKCISTGRTDLASDNVNSWIETYGKDMLFRVYDDTVRGVLSDRYMMLDTPDIIRTLMKVVDMSSYKVKGHYISPERFHLRLVSKEMMNVEGEDLFHGIQIDSSDVGRSTLVARFIIYKQVCTNGLCVSRGDGVLFKQKHVGISAEEFESNFQSSLSKIPELVSNFEGLVVKAFKEDKGYKISSLSQEELEAFLSRTKAVTNLSDEALEHVSNLMTNVYSETKWGLINSITQVAQDYTLERRIELEQVAGTLLMTT